MRRPLRKFGIALGVLLLVLGLAAGGVLLYLHSAAGGALVRAQLVQAVNGAIAGRLEVGKATLWGGETLVLEDLELFTPEGELVASVKRVEVKVDLVALARRQVRVQDASIDTATLLLHRDARGLSLSRAVEARVAAAAGPETAAKPAELTVDVGHLELRNSRVEYQDADRTVRLEEVAMSGGAHLRTGPFDLAGDVKLKGQLEGPVDDALALEVHAASTARGAWTVDVKANGGGLSLAGNLDAKARRITLRQLLVKEKLGRAVLPEVWPLADAEVKGTLELNRADLEVALLGGGGTAKVAGTWDLSEGKSGVAATVTLEAVNLAKVKEGLPTTHLGGTLSGALTDLRPASLTGKMDLKGQWRDEAGDRVVDLAALLEANAGLVKVAPASLDLPGAHLDVNGTASEAKLNLTGHLRADDAGLAGRTLARAVGLELPALTAQGVLDVKVEGPVLNPAVLVNGKLARIALGELSGSGVEVSGAVPSLRRWREVDATLSVQRLSVGDTVFEAVRLGLETRGREVSLDLSSRGLTAVLIRAAGRLEGDNALALATVTLEWPGTVWTMESPSRLSWENGLDLLPLLLRAGPQAIELELHKPPGKLMARARVVGLDISRLPVAFVPRKLGLGGVLDGTVVAEGAVSAPKVSAAANWTQGKVRTLSGIDVHAEAQLEGGRTKGTLTGSIGAAKVEGNFDLPLKPGKASADTPLSIAVQLDAWPFAEAFALADAAPVLEGTVRLGATLQGTVGDPRLALDASTLGAVLKPGGGRPDVSLHSVAVAVETRADGTPAVHLDLSALGGTLRADGTTPQKLGALLWRPPDAAAARALDWTVDAAVSGLGLAALRPFFPDALTPLEGTLALDAHAHGPAAAPSLDANLKLVDLSSPEFKPVQVAVVLEGGPSSLQARLAMRGQDQQLLSLEAKSALALSDVLANTIDAQKSFSLGGTAGPVDLKRLAALRGDANAQMTGTLQATLEAGGTLAAPTLALRGALEGLQLHKTALGKATLAWDYAAAKSALKLAMTSTNRGQLQANGEVALDLGLAALQSKGFAPLSAPLRATVAARGFDLSFLSGAHPALRTLGGRVTADASLAGTLGAPGFDGRLVWNQGRLGLAGMSEFKDIELAVTGTSDRLAVEKLDARSGAGTLTLTGEARRQSAAQWAFDGKVATDKLPLVTDDQLRCMLDVHASVEGQLTPEVWNISRLSIPDALVQLPVLRKKDAQSLDRPKDIVLVRDGVALGPKPKRWKKKAAAELASGAPLAKDRVVRVAIVAPDNLKIRGTDVNLEVGLSDGFNLEYDQQLFLNGEVRVLGGKVEVLGRKFEVQKDSTVRFSGPAAAPALNVTAAYVNEREKVTVYATLVGASDDLAFRTSSQPPLSDTEIYSLLATGRRSLRSGSGGSAISAEQGLSVLGAVVASQLKSALAEKLPVELLDVLEISAGGEGFKGTRLEAGKYLSDRLYIGYVGQVGADPRKGENGNAGRIEYQFAPGWSVQATAGDAPAGSAELVWGIEF